MTASHQATQFGRSIQAPNEAWLAKQPPEPILEPDLPIIDTHHHFWDRATDRPGHRYLLDELLADLNTGHNIGATVSSNAVRCTAPMGLRKCARSAKPSSSTASQR